MNSIMATPESTRTARQPPPPSHPHPYPVSTPHSPFRIPATPRAKGQGRGHRARPSTSSSQASCTPWNSTVSRAPWESDHGSAPMQNVLLGSPFSVTRVAYTSAKHPSASAGPSPSPSYGLSVSSSMVMPRSETDTGRAHAMDRGDMEEMEVEEALALSDTPSRRARRSQSGSSCSGSGTSSASLLSLGRSSEEHRRFSVAIWDETEGMGVHMTHIDPAQGDRTLAAQSRALFGGDIGLASVEVEGHCDLKQARTEDRAGAGERGSSKPRLWQGDLDMDDLNASMVTLSPPTRTSTSPAKSKMGGKSATRKVRSRSGSPCDDDRPIPTSTAKPLPLPLHASIPGSGSGSGSNSTPARRKSPFHFIPRLIPAYRRRTRAPSSSGTAGGREALEADAEAVVPASVAGINRPELPSGQKRGNVAVGLAVSIPDRTAAIDSAPSTSTSAATGTSSFTESQCVSSFRYHDAHGPARTVDFGTGLSPALMARTPSSPSCGPMHLPHAPGVGIGAGRAMQLRAFPSTSSSTNTSSAGNEVDEDELDVPSPSKPPMGHRPGNPRRSTAPGLEKGSMLAPSAFTLSPGPGPGPAPHARARTAPGLGSGHAVSPTPMPGSGSSTKSSGSGSGSSRPSLRRGITAPGAFGFGGFGSITSRAALENATKGAGIGAGVGHGSGAEKNQFATPPPPPPMFGDIRPSPAAFASTGLIKKKSGMRPGFNLGHSSNSSSNSHRLEGMYSPALVSDRPRFNFDRLAKLHVGPLGKRLVESSDSTSTAPSESASNSATGSNLASAPSRSTDSSRVPPGRGLRRKGSAMFSTSGSSGSISISANPGAIAGGNGNCNGNGIHHAGPPVSGRGRSGSVLSLEQRRQHRKVGSLASLGSLGGVAEGSPVTPTKHGFNPPFGYNTVTPPPQRAGPISYPFARPQNRRPSGGKLDSPTLALAMSPVAQARPQVRCLGDSTSTNASTGTEGSSGTETGSDSSPLRRPTHAYRKSSLSGIAHAQAHGPLARASNPMLASTFRQHAHAHTLVVPEERTPPPARSLKAITTPTAQIGNNTAAATKGQGQHRTTPGDWSSSPIRSKSKSIRAPIRGMHIRYDDCGNNDTHDANGIDDYADAEGNEVEEEPTDVDDDDDDDDDESDCVGPRPLRQPHQGAQNGIAVASKWRARHKPALRLQSSDAAEKVWPITSARGGQVHGPRRNKLDTDFVLVQGVGQGEFSQVWKVRSRADGRVSAVKAGKPYTGVKNRLRQLEEVSILHTLRQSALPTNTHSSDIGSFTHHLVIEGHPHVLPFMSAWEHRSRLYIQTELLPSGDLSRFLEACGDTAGLGEVRAWKLLVELTDALRYIHARGIVHLDIKPGNIFIAQDGSVKVGDFGMAARLKRAGPPGTTGGMVFASTGVEVALAEPPLQLTDGTFVWPDDAAAAAGSEGRKDVLQVASSTQPGQYASPSPMLERDVEGDREYLAPEALNDDAVSCVGTHSDVFSVGIMLLEAVGNVALPSNGEGWHRLRNDDYTDLDDCYVLRTKTDRDACTGEVISELDMRVGTDTNVPVLSDDLLSVIKRLMASDPKVRVGLEEVWEMPLVQRARMLMRENRSGNETQQAVWAGALVEEDEDAVGLLFP